ncbi:MAG TPA: class I SAM-dependent methyltransferase [Dehalococcoidia bacterium]|nr:class I SAM-dependent methyltransferase [Dehalococcoidia bacterium]
MKNTIAMSGRLSGDELASYWLEVSERHLAEKDEGLGVICFAGMPAWFNRFYDRYQRKGFERLLQDEDFSNQRILDIGTGVGRWAREFARYPGAEVVGIDMEPLRLAQAREQGDSVTYLQMPVDALDFPDASFDAVNSITVLQHTPHEVKRRAIAEFGRVLRPGGRAVIFELTDMNDGAPHVYPWSRDTWLAELEQNGLSCRRMIGEQYTPVLRLIKAAYGTIKGRDSRLTIDEMKSGQTSARARVYMAALVPAVAVSYPIEEVARFLPPGFAKITGFLLDKTNA